MMRYKTLIAKVAIFSLVLSLVAFVGPTQAASLTDMSDTMTRQAVSIASDHTIVFTTPTGIATDDTVTVTFPAGFDLTSLVATGDIDIEDDGSALTTAADCTGTEQAGVDVTGQVITITICSDYTGGIAATSEVTVNIGTSAASGVNQVVNHASAGSYDLTIGGTMADSGTIQIPVLDGDQVTINGEVESTMTFDLNVNTATTEYTATSDQPYLVDLGTLSTSSVTTSGVSSIPYINVQLSANATGGVVVTVKNANNADGLQSVSDTSDDIEVATGDISAGTEAYGICVNQVVAGANSTFAVVAGNFHNGALSANDATATSTTCTPGAHDLGATNLSSTATTILSSTGPLAGGWSSIMVKAAISNTTPAHDDYTDTLTFIATGTF